MREPGDGGDRVRTVVLDPTPFPEVSRENGYVPLEVKKGAVIALHALCPHLSGGQHLGGARGTRTRSTPSTAARATPEGNLAPA